MNEPSIETFHQRTTANRAATLFAATRPPFLTASLLTIVTALSLSYHIAGTLRLLPSLLTLAAMLLIHAGANVLNDYFDARSGTDAANQGRIFPFTGGSRFIQNGVLTEAQTLYLASWLLSAGALIGVWLVLHSGPLLLGLGVMGGVLAILYSAPPCLVCRGLGDIVIAICFGLLPTIGTVYIQLGSVPTVAIWLGTSLGVFAATILWVNSIPDIPADRSTNKLTLPARLGTRHAVRSLPMLFIFGFLLLVLSPAPMASWSALLAVVPAVMASRSLDKGQFIPSIPLTLLTHASFCLLLSAALLAT